MDNSLTAEESYKAMYIFLSRLHDMTHSEDLAGFLGSMATLDDGRPVDAAIWEDWIEAIEEVKKGMNINLQFK